VKRFVVHSLIACGLIIYNPATGAAKEANAPVKIDYSRIAFDSAPGRDSFSLAMQAAARLLGSKAGYAEILALSTNGFAPDVRPDEECRSDWMTRSRGQCLDLVADRLGIKVRPLGGFAAREYGKKPDPDAAQKAAVLIADALSKGEVVITDSGWNESFSLWGIVTAANVDGRIGGANPAAKNNSLDHACSFWALSRGGSEMPQAEADRVMLARAAARIRGDREPFRPDSLVLGLPATGAPAVPGAVVWGLPAMDLWIAQMGKPAYQQDDPGSSAGNARMCALYVSTGAKATAAYLRRRMKSFPAAARRQLESVAGRYEKVAALLEPYSVWKKGKGYQAFMGSLQEQNAHADRVLRPVRVELVAAAGEIETALAAIGSR